MKHSAPAQIEGFVRAGFEPVRQAFVENFTQRGELGGACCIYRHGEKVVDLWAACATAAAAIFGARTRWSRCTPRAKGPIRTSCYVTGRMSLHLQGDPRDVALRQALAKVIAPPTSRARAPARRAEPLP